MDCKCMICYGAIQKDTISIRPVRGRLPDPPLCIPSDHIGSTDDFLSRARQMDAQV